MKGAVGVYMDGVDYISKVYPYRTRKQYNYNLNFSCSIKFYNL